MKMKLISLLLALILALSLFACGGPDEQPDEEQQEEQLPSFGDRDDKLPLMPVQPNN